jgi:Na+-driven multidrug efflux pump
MARAATAFAAVIFIVFSRQISGLSTKNAAVINAAAPLFVFIALIQFMQSVQMSTSGALRAAGDTMYPLYATIAGIWVFRIGMCAIFVYWLKMGLAGAWFAFFLDQSLRSVIISLRFRSGKWRLMRAKKLAGMARKKETLM